MRFILLVYFIWNFEETYAQVLSKTQAKEDLNFFIQKLESLHPDPKAYFPNYSTYLDSLYFTFPDQISIESFAQKAALFANKFKDGHTYIQNSPIPPEAGLLPFEVVIKGERVFIKNDISSGNGQDLAGAELLNINGVATREVLDRMLPFSGGETIEHQLARSERGFERNVYRLFGEINQIEVMINKEPLILEPNLVSKAEWDQHLIQNRHLKNDFRYLESKIALLEFVDMHSISKKEFAAYLNDAFRQIHKNKSTKLIIDLRNNGGGNFLFGKMLISYLTDSPYRLHDKYQYDKEGKKVNKSMIEPVKPQKQKYRFGGEVYFLTSAYTYSSAATLVAAAKYNDIGKIIGQPIGQPYSGFIDMKNFTLPHSKLQMGVSTVYYEYMGITEENRLKGIEPHVYEYVDALEELISSLLEN